MKQTLFLLVFTLLAGSGFSQNAHAQAVVKQVDSLLLTANNLRKAGKNADALPFAQQAADLSRQTWGENNVKYAAALHRLATIYTNLNQIDTAEHLYLQAIDLRAKLLGKDHLDYAQTLNTLANLYIDQGQYATAEPLYITAKNIREKKLGKENEDYAQSANNLANLYQATGEYAKAEALQVEAKEIRFRLFGHEHESYAQSLNNLANLYMDKGDYAKAEPLHLESKEIRARVLGKQHPDYGQTLNNLANVYSAEGKYAQAETLYLEANALWAKVLGMQHPHFAGSCLNLANLYSAQGNYAKAEPLYWRAADIQQKALGEDHPDYAQSLQSLGLLYYHLGDYDRAERLYLQAKAIEIKVLWKQHPQYAATLRLLAELYWKTGRIAESKTCFTEMNERNRWLVEQAATYSSEREMLAYLNMFEQPLAEFLSFTQAHPDPELTKACFDNALFYHGFLLENMRSLNREVSAQDSITRNYYDRWKDIRRRLAREYTKPVVTHSRTDLTDMEVKAEEYEVLLLHHLREFQRIYYVTHWQDVHDHLQAGEAAIAFVNYRYFSPVQTDSNYYAALVIRPEWDAPKIISLFEEKTLSVLLKPSGARRADYVNSIYSFANKNLKTTGKKSQNLYDIVWKPLEYAVTGIKTVYFSPTGLLHRINFSAIARDEQHILADRFNLVELGTTRQLAKPSVSAQYRNEAFLAGGIQFDLDSTAIYATNKSIVQSGFSRTTEASIGFDTSDTSLRGGNWNYLPWTEKEVDTLESILTAAHFSPSVEKGFAATEEVFKTLGFGKASPYILHIATHGFFFPDPMETFSPVVSAANPEPVFKISEHPMIRSGLLLAGANYAWKTGASFKPTMDDGILTAYEISQMDLSNTELVVLSACETGLGDIQGNEGVYGLQRAFKIAGARYLIMSLWQVPDFQTQELMAAFYTNWLTNKMTIPVAFRAAQQTIRDTYQHPYFWAGFILME